VRNNKHKKMKKCGTKSRTEINRLEQKRKRKKLKSKRGTKEERQGTKAGQEGREKERTIERQIDEQR
jgi:hypothetical protein